jgi:hypothetical protein
MAAAFLLMGLCLAVPGWLAWHAMTIAPGSGIKGHAAGKEVPTVALAHLVESEEPPEPSAGKNGKLLAQGSPEHFDEESIRRGLNDPIGRSNPFEPLIRPVTDTAGFGPNPGSEKRDLLQDLQYTGFIGDAQSKDKVAIIRIADPIAGSKTVIKKSGESFPLEGKQVVITSIARDGLRLTLEGQSRWLALQPYAETAPPTSSSGSATPLNNLDALQKLPAATNAPPTAAPGAALQE